MFTLAGTIKARVLLAALAARAKGDRCGALSGNVLLAGLIGTQVAASGGDGGELLKERHYFQAERSEA